MTHDDDGLTPGQRRRFLLRSRQHQELLVSDALACGLTALYQRRRDRSRQLRQRLADLDAEDTGDSRKRA